MSQAVLLVFSIAERALAANSMGPGKRDVLFQQHSQDLVVVPVGCQDDWSHIHGGGILWILNPLHQFLKRHRYVYKILYKSYISACSFYSY